MSATDPQAGPDARSTAGGGAGGQDGVGKATATGTATATVTALPVRTRRRGPLPVEGALAAPMTAEALAALAARINGQPIIRHLGGVAALRLDGVAEVWLPEVQPFHVGGMETQAVNGPVILAMLDCALVSAGLVQFEGARSATLEMSVKIMRLVLPREVRAVGYAVSKTRTIVFARADVYDLRNQVRAAATGIITRL